MEDFFIDGSISPCLLDEPLAQQFCFPTGGLLSLIMTQGSVAESFALDLRQRCLETACPASLGLGELPSRKRQPVLGMSRTPRITNRQIRADGLYERYHDP